MPIQTDTFNLKLTILWTGVILGSCILYKIYNLKEMLGSSTPQGLAPIDTTALIVLIATIGGLSMVWGIANLIILFKFSPDAEVTEKAERISQVTRKLLRGTLDVMKMNLLVGFIATIIFAIVIMVLSL